MKELQLEGWDISTITINEEDKRITAKKEIEKYSTSVYISYYEHINTRGVLDGYISIDTYSSSKDVYIKKLGLLLDGICSKKRLHTYKDFVKILKMFDRYMKLLEKDTEKLKP